MFRIRIIDFERFDFAIFKVLLSDTIKYIVIFPIRRAYEMGWNHFFYLVRTKNEEIPTPHIRVIGLYCIGFLAD